MDLLASHDDTVHKHQNQWHEYGWCQIAPALHPEYVSALHHAMNTLLPEDASPSSTPVVVEKLWDPFNDFTPLWTWLNSDGLSWISSVTQHSLIAPKRNALRIESLHSAINRYTNHSRGVHLWLSLHDIMVPIHCESANGRIPISLAPNQFLLSDPHRVRLHASPQENTLLAQYFMVTIWLDTTAP